MSYEDEFISGEMTERGYLQNNGIWLKKAHAGVYHGRVVIWIGGKRPPWERCDKDERATTLYKNWRTAVFERDKYTCQKCGQVGGELNAHHIKSFSKYKRKRFKVENGITLCKACHKAEHYKSGE